MFEELNAYDCLAQNGSFPISKFECRFRSRSKNTGLDARLAAFRTEISCDEGVGVLNPIAKQRTRVSRVNYFFHAEGFRGPEGRAVLSETVFDFAAANGRIGSRFGLAPGGGVP